MKRSDLRQLLAKRVLVSDGAIGTLLQSQGALAGGGCPELVNLQQPELVQSVHLQYLAAGCDILQTNTFGGNALKLAEYGLGDQMQRINLAAAEIAQTAVAGRALVAGDIGPCGQLLHPLGQLTFEQAIELYYQQAKALVAGGVDLLLIETMSDLHEAKAAVIGARAATSELPIICSLTYDQGLRTLTGADPETVVTVLEALGADVVGTNCGFGPEPMTDILKRQYNISASMLLVQPNAGLPRWQDGKTVFSLGPTAMASHVKQLIQSGANIIGGCCGTTPEHLRLMVAEAHKYAPLPRRQPAFSKLAGATETIYIGNHLPTSIVGERINPTARKKLAQALKSGDFGVLAQEASDQIEAGAAMIDVNVGTRVPGLTEADLMPQAILAVQRTTNAPLSIDTADGEAMLRALQVCRGKPLLNSTNGDEENLERITDLASRYGAAILGLTLDSRGIPETAAERLEIARRIVDRALSKGIRREDIYIDGLTMTAGASQELVLETLRTIQLVKSELGVRTALGVSNVSHGLPERGTLNNVFLAMALAAGLDLPIVNPSQDGLWSVISAADVITNRDRHATGYLRRVSLQTEQPIQPPAPSAPQQPAEQLVNEILTGNQAKLPALTDQLLQQGWSAFKIVNDLVIKAMETAGEKYDQRRFFLPQLLLAAEAAQATFQLLRTKLEQTASEQLGTVVLATVKGDIHDIGKSIVGLLLKNHGFRVIDLGKDVDHELIVQTARAEQAHLVALSALMTTTMPQMGVVAEQLRAQGLTMPLLIGGAVVTAEYATAIGATYASDATEAVRQAKRLVKGVASECKD